MRLRFLDTARFVAVVMMVLAHVRDGLLAPDGNSHWLARLHDHSRGFTAPLFFIVAGWAFAAATLPRWPAFGRWGPPLRARLERIAVLFVLGKLLTLPWWHEGFPMDVPRDVWLPFLTSGVLECLAAAMLVAHLVLPFAASARAFIVWMLAFTGLAVVGAAPLQDAAAGWPAAARGLFNSDGTGGGFAFAPFAAYFFLGSALGTAAATLRLDGRRCALACGVLAGAALGAGALLAGSFTAPRMSLTSPALFLTRVGWVLLLLAALAALHERLPARASLERLSGRALTFYVGHMLLLWGVPFMPGLVHRVQRGATVGAVIGISVAMLCGLSLWCVVSERLEPHPEPDRARGG